MQVVPGVRHFEPAMHTSAKSQGVFPLFGKSRQSARPSLPEKRKPSQHTLPSAQSSLSSQRAIRLQFDPR